MSTLIWLGIFYTWPVWAVAFAALGLANIYYSITERNNDG